MYDAVCSDCGQATQVPFKPDPARPVYCRDCFAKRRPRRFWDRQRHSVRTFFVRAPPGHAAGAELVFLSSDT